MEFSVDVKESDLPWTNHKQLLAQLLTHAHKQHKLQAKGNWQSLAELLSIKENGGLQLSAEILMQYRRGRQSVSLRRAQEVADGVTRAGIRSPEIDNCAQTIRALTFWEKEGAALSEFVENGRKSTANRINKLTKLLHKLVPELVDPGLVGSDPQYSDLLTLYVTQTIQTITQQTIDACPDEEERSTTPLTEAFDSRHEKAVAKPQEAAKTP